MLDVRAWREKDPTEGIKRKKERGMNMGWKRDTIDFKGGGPLRWKDHVPYNLVFGKKIICGVCWRGNHVYR